MCTSGICKECHQREAWIYCNQQYKKRRQPCKSPVKSNDDIEAFCEQCDPDLLNCCYESPDKKSKCLKVFASPSGRAKHWNEERHYTEAAGVKVFRCPTCDNVYQYEMSLNCHKCVPQRTRAVVVDRPVVVDTRRFKCLFSRYKIACDAKFDSVEALLKHWNDNDHFNHRAGIRIHQCGTCRLVFLVWESVINHMSQEGHRTRYGRAVEGHGNTDIDDYLPKSSKPSKRHVPDDPAAQDPLRTMSELVKTLPSDTQGLTASTSGVGTALPWPEPEPYADYSGGTELQYDPNPFIGHTDDDSLAKDSFRMMPPPYEDLPTRYRRENDAEAARRSWGQQTLGPPNPFASTTPQRQPEANMAYQYAGDTRLSAQSYIQPHQRQGRPPHGSLRRSRATESPSKGTEL